MEERIAESKSTSELRTSDAILLSHEALVIWKRD